MINEFKKFNLQKPRYYEENELISITCEALIKQKIVAWFQGCSEFGPRALGNRSFLADPRKVNIREIINSKIKKGNTLGLLHHLVYLSMEKIFLILIKIALI